MGKRKGSKCKHGNSCVYMQGCATCVTTAMKAFYICRDNGWTAEELWGLLHEAFKTEEALVNAITKVRGDIAARAGGAK